MKKTDISYPNLANFRTALAVDIHNAASTTSLDLPKAHRSDLIVRTQWNVMRSVSGCVTLSTPPIPHKNTQKAQVPEISSVARQIALCWV